VTVVDGEVGSSQGGAARGRHFAEKRSKGAERGSHPLAWAGGALGGVLVLAAVGVGAAWFLGRGGVSLTPSSTALAKVDHSGAAMSLTSASATYGGQSVSLVMRDGELVPTTPVPAGAKLDVTAEFRRPSWAAWLLGSTVRAQTSVRTPSASLLNPVAVVQPGHAVVARFSEPVSVVAYSVSGQDPVEHLARPSSTFELVTDVTDGQTGTISVAAVPRSWEALPTPSKLTYYGAAGTTPLAFVQPALTDGTLTLSGTIQIHLSAPVSKVFGSQLPTLTPVVHGALVPSGTWHQTAANALEFVPSGPAFWPGEEMRLSFPAAVSVVEAGVKPTAAVSDLTFTPAAGSVLRLQQLLATLGYLPVRFEPTNPSAASPTTLDGQAALASNPPQGTFAWRFTPQPALEVQWAPGSYNVMTEAAVMDFEHVSGLNFNQSAGPNPLLWPTLLKAVVAHKMDPHPYSWVEVSENLPEQAWIYLNGKVAIHTLVNTGIPAAPTATGTYAVYERLPFQIMRGTNPDGSSYADPVHWINYFNGSDAVHGFYRPDGYGFPQSVGCVELPIPTAAEVYPLLHIGTLVTILP